MKYLITGLLCIVAFGLGYFTHKPKIITITKEIKVYDFTQEPKVMEYYANMMGKTLESKKDIDEYRKNSLLIVENYRHTTWQEGYREGYIEGFRKGSEIQR